MDLEGKYSCSQEMKKSIYGRQEKYCRAGGTEETWEERRGGIRVRDEVDLHCPDPFPVLRFPGPSILSTSLRAVRYARRQEHASSPSCKNLTLGCPARGGPDPEWGSAFSTPVPARLLLPLQLNTTDCPSAGRPLLLPLPGKPLAAAGYSQ